MMSRYLVLGIAASLLLSPMSAIAQSLDWMTQIGTLAHEGAEMAVSADGAGSIVVASRTEGELVAGAQQGGRDAWVAGFDSAGVEQWIHQFGTSVEEGARAVLHDGAGGAIVGGYTFGNLFGPSAGFTDAFIARFSATGLVWGKQLGASGRDSVYDLAPDDAGGFYVTGAVEGSVGGPSAGRRDFLLARYDVDGNQLWIRQRGSAAVESESSLAPDGKGGVFLTGRSEGSLAGPGQGGSDVVILHYDADGELLWERQFGTPGSDRPNSIEPDGSSGFYVGGNTTGSLVGPSAGFEDAWLARYDGDGNQLWIVQFGTSDSDFGSGLAQDGAGGVYFLGATGHALFGPSAGDWDVWIAQFTADGDRIWETQLGSGERDSASDATPDGNGGAIFGGATGGDLGGPSFGLNDIWLAYVTDGCYADCDADGLLDFFDFLCFQTTFALGEPGADCDGNETLDFFDFLCFQSEFAAGCP